MKKLFILFVMCFAAHTMQAQRCAVFDFQVGTGVTEEDIEGISYEFRSKFIPQGYTKLDYSYVINTIKSAGYNPTDMSHQQMMKVGRSLDAVVVVVGTMNKFMDEYSVDIRAIDVSSGRTIATEGANFVRTDYRASIKKAAQGLASKLASKNTSSSSSSSSTSSSLSQPSKIVPKGYVDLGLPSGTLWKEYNESGFYTYNDAIQKFGNRLPTKEQLQELKDKCSWEWLAGTYKVTGSNGNCIGLPAEGCPDGFDWEANVRGYYWSSTPSYSLSKELKEAWCLDFTSYIVSMHESLSAVRLSVRLVLNP